MRLWSEGGGLEQTDNPSESSGLCCDKATKKTFKVGRCLVNRVQTNVESASAWFHR